MSLHRREWTDTRYRKPVTMTVVEPVDPYASPYMPPVYIAPADRPEVECEVGGGEDFTRCTRDDLREWAEAILTALDNT